MIMDHPFEQALIEDDRLLEGAGACSQTMEERPFSSPIHDHDRGCRRTGTPLDKLRVDLLPHHATLVSLRRILIALSDYAIEYRYPGRSASTRKMHAALRHAERVRLSARTILGMPP